MLHLDLNTAPFWLDLGYGVRVLVEPLSALLLTRARSLPECEAAAGDDDNHRDVSFAILTNAVAKTAIRDWEGVGDENGDPLAISPDAIGALLDLPQIHRVFAAQYVAKAFLLVTEKNASSPSLNGTSAGELNTAVPAADPAQTAPAT